MQSAHVSASVREQLQKRLKRLAEQTSHDAPSQSTSSTDHTNIPTAHSNFSNTNIAVSLSPSKQRTSQPVDESGDKLPSLVQSDLLSSLNPIRTETKNHHVRPPVQLLRGIETLENAESRKLRQPPLSPVRNKTRRAMDGMNKNNERRASERLPEWRATSNVQNRDLAARSGPSNVEKLSSLDKQLSFALSNCGRQSRRREPVVESEHAFLDDSPVDDFHERIPDPAKTYPFELDDFQKRAILHIEQQSCVFVAAHTSAGKTAIAEYAIALAALGGAKVFYTSPIKTLSNQKLRDFRSTFDDVGLVTGDVSINENAQCVIMTTEILRSMLYRGADAIRDVSYVIFDEVQFLNDEERGVVWEESIIMLPPHIGIIMLSATVPNALEFASWVGKTKDKQHPGASSDELEASLLLGQDGRFLDDNFIVAATALKGVKSDKKRKARRKKNRSKQSQGGNMESENVGTDENVTDGIDAYNSDDTASAKNINTESGEPSSNIHRSHKKSVKGRNENKGPATKAAKTALRGEEKGSGQGPNSRRSPWLPLISFLRDRAQTPTVVFCFSKKGCERAVESLEGSDLLPNAADKAHAHKLFETAIMRLREEDRNLPQVKRVFANLKRGISAHHAGLLPIVKEITEILFSEGLVKVLFATETFAMGVNMPARTVVFAGVRKNDGRRFRALEAGEYTQMSGRAGRRGKDLVGNVYLFFPPGESIPDQGRMKYIMTGKPISLKSAFRLTYNMILNVLRVDELRVEEVMKRSFSEARGDANQENIGKVLSLAGDTLNEVHEEQLSRAARLGGSGGLGEYISKFSEVNEMSSALTFRELNPIFKEALRPGRLVIAELESGRLCLSVVFSVIPRYGNVRKKGRKGEEDNVIKRETQLWIAYLHSVTDQHAGKHVKSILVLPESIDRERLSRRACRDPFQVTNDGLVIVLKKIQASRIVCIFDEIYDFSAEQALQQADATRAYHFSGKSNHIYKWLSQNASYLQTIVCGWKRKMNRDKVPLFDAISSEWSASRTASIFGQLKKKSHLTSNTLEGYQTLAGLCRRMATSTPLYNSLVAKSASGLMSKIKELIIQESIRIKLDALKTVQETGNQPRLLPDYQNRIAVLQKLDYIGSDGMNVQLKGRCGCEVLTADSLVLTEIVCENVLHGLGPAEVASLLSSLVCRKKNPTGIHDKDPEKYSEAYCHAKAQMRTVVQNVGKVQEESSVELEFDIADGCDDYESSVCRWDLAEAVYEWAKGEPFCNITDLTEQQEGDIVVCVKRLSELLKDAQSVAKGVGNLELVSVLEDAVSCIRRDVIFNGSLYYDEDLHKHDM